jgi:hypothetical protein
MRMEVLDEAEKLAGGQRWTWMMRNWREIWGRT